jgi:Ca2+-binding RTX toxin-like protein
MIAICLGKNRCKVTKTACVFLLVYSVMMLVMLTSVSRAVATGSRISSVGRDGENIIRGCSFIEGTNSADFIISCPTDTLVFGKSGGDEIQTSFGNDQVYGGPGNDVIQTNGGNDQLFGDSGDDNLVAAEGNDLLVGGPGNDHLFAGFGDDQLIGGPGADYFDCGDGIDEVKDFNPHEGDTIGTDCEIVHTVG